MAIRTFEKLTAAGWSPTAVNKVAPRDVIRVLDDGVPQLFAPDALFGDAGIYTVSQVQRSVTVAVITASGTREQPIDFTP